MTFTQSSYLSTADLHHKNGSSQLWSRWWKVWQHWQSKSSKSPDVRSKPKKEVFENLKERKGKWKEAMMLKNLRFEFFTALIYIKILVKDVIQKFMKQVQCNWEQTSKQNGLSFVFWSVSDILYLLVCFLHRNRKKIGTLETRKCCTLMMCKIFDT